MTLQEIIERYDTPETLSKLPEPKVREIYNACSQALTPLGRYMHLYFFTLDKDNERKVLNVKKMAMQELRGRDDVWLGLQERERSFPQLLNEGGFEIGLKAALSVGLIDESGVWIYEGFKTNGASLFWKALVSTSLAKPNTPTKTIKDAMEIQFSLKLGKNAINTNKKPEEYNRDEQEMYNELIYEIDRLKKGKG